MEKRHLEWKVGIFVLVTVVVLAGLMLLFSKGFRFSSTYTLRLTTSNVGLLIAGAPVLMAGVEIGHIDRIRLDPSGKSVTLWVEVKSQYSIYRDARFVIDQIGLLGDQYISVIPQVNIPPVLKDGDQAPCEEPFNVQSIARSSMGLIQRVDETVQRLKAVVVRVDDLLLSPQTLSNLNDTLANLYDVSERASSGIDGLDALVQTNRDNVTATVSNLVLFSKELNTVGHKLNDVVETNRAGLAAAVTNIQSASERVNRLLVDIESGKGLVGLVFHDSQARDNTAHLISNLTLLSSNLNRFGLLYKPKKKPETSPLPYPAKKY
jgi:phospholipid/cholesterol/gamma-HCH transport system substrate-binding protein